MSWFKINGRDNDIFKRPILIIFILQIVVILFYRQRLDDIPVYEDVESRCVACGHIEELRQKPGKLEITIGNVNVHNGTSVKDNHKILIYSKDDGHSNSKDYFHGFRIGQKIRVSGKAFPFEQQTNPGGFDSASYYHNMKIAYLIMGDNISVTDEKYSFFPDFISRLSGRLSRVYYDILPENDAQLVCAAVLGRKYLISEEDSALYRRNGIMHILAISGMHVSIIAMIIIWIMSHLPVSYNTSRLITAAMLLFYGCMAGFSVSCVRAVIMILLTILANVTGRRYDIINGISLSGIIILLKNPNSLFSAGFLLSYCAVFGIAVFAKTVMDNIFINEPGSIKKSLFSCILVSVFTTPVIIYFYNDVPLYSFLINLIVIPLMTLIFIMALICGTLGLTGAVGLSRFFGGSIHFILSVYKKLCVFGDKYFYDFRITGSKEPWICIVCMLLMICVMFFLVKFRGNIFKNKIKTVFYINIKRFAVFAVLVFVLLVLSINTKRSDFQITMLNVGQGEAVHLGTGDGLDIMIDGGSTSEKNISRYVLEPYFTYMGIRKIDMWILTHMDSDHTSGFMEMLDRHEINKIKVDTLVLSDIGDKSDYEAFKPYEGSVIRRIVYIKNGNEFNRDNLIMKCINPDTGIREEKTKDVNDSSIVLSVRYKDFNALFTGDISSETEKELLRKGLIYRHELLKVAHHGSKNSSAQEFLDAVKPRFALISAGENNTYGHPNKETLKRLKKQPCSIYRTDESGAIMLKAEDGKIYIKKYRK